MLRKSDTLFKFFLNVINSSSVAGNNCLQVATYVFEFARLCGYNFIMIVMRIPNTLLWFLYILYLQSAVIRIIRLNIHG